MQRPERVWITTVNAIVFASLSACGTDEPEMKETLVQESATQPAEERCDEPGPAEEVRITLEFSSDIPEDAYVQTRGNSGSQSWVTLRGPDGELYLEDLCGTPLCGETAVACESGPPLLENLTNGNVATGAISLTWDGLDRAFSENGCQCPVQAPAGDYEAEFCVGFTVEDGQGFSGRGEGVVSNIVCETVAFTMPTTELVFHLAHGG